MKVTRRETRPGELFLGGRGILTPYRPTLDRSHRDENKLAASTVSPDPLDAQPSTEEPNANWAMQSDEQMRFEADNENWTPEMIAPVEELDKIMGWDEKTSPPATDEIPESTPK